MEIVDFHADHGEPVTQFGAHGVAAVRLAHGEGAAHVHVLHVDAGGEIGVHPNAGGQLLVVVAGRGWVREGDGPRLEIDVGQAAYLPRGTVHSAGSHDGMTVVAVEVTDLSRDLP